MKSLTLQAGVPEEEYDAIVQVDQEITTNELKSRLEFLQNVYENEYLAVKMTFSLVPAETWHMYKLLGQHNLSEQKELRRDNKMLKRAWAERFGNKKDKA